MRRVAWYVWADGNDGDSVSPAVRDVSSLVGVAKSTAGAFVEAVQQGRKSSGEAVREMLSPH